MKKIFSLLLVLAASFISAQTIVPHGTLILKTDQRIDFVNLKLENGTATLNNIATNVSETYPMSVVKSIQGKVADPSEIIAEVPKAATVEKDTRFRPDYPEGIYKSPRDFLNKTPSSVQKVVPKSLGGFEKEVLTRVEEQCFFFYAADDSKVKNVFAISYNGHLFFQLEAVLKNRNKTDRAQTNSQHNQFIRVRNGGENYFYAEAELANQWEQGFAYGGLGGGVGAAMARGAVHTKGIVWDFKNQEFNIFKNCKDYNEFIKDKYPNGVIDCKRRQPEITDVRRAIEFIK